MINELDAKEGDGSMIPEFDIERFMVVGDRMKAQKELAAMGTQAIPIIASILSGEAKNKFGIAYNSFGPYVPWAVHAILKMNPNEVRKENLLPLIPLLKPLVWEERHWDEDACNLAIHYIESL